MGLHEKLTIKDSQPVEILRVPGGWIYTYFQLNQVMMQNGGWSEEYIPSSIFVPFNNEFQKKS